MSETDPEAGRATAGERLMERLRSFARGTGMSGTDTRSIIGRVIASDPSVEDGDHGLFTSLEGVQGPDAV
ncbi:hypothetical protein LOK46_21155 [Methylobacterium sp. NMS14P]|uniref:hypothetical protein n=1 Tax=Methylobacterium sp. NMS14P TaxID=2894310 RepID=UPI0023589733|nr:hypothetical protein [Methylobacterium sp. NMS14P]WCS23655.1 hypothetical protein LOK46_21155 [Methylobacterium sp. NMS14P]